MFETHIVCMCVLLNNIFLVFSSEAQAHKVQYLVGGQTQQHVSFYPTFRKKQGISIY